MLKILRCSQRLSAQCRTILPNSWQKSQIDRRILMTNFHNSANCRSKDDPDSKNKDSTDIAPNIASRYEVFTDEKATIVLDMEEERDKLLAGELDIEEVDDTPSSFYVGLNTERGKTGVFDIEDLITVLKRDNAQEIFVCTVPKELKYVDYMVVLTARSHRHMKAMAEFVRKMFKIKRGENDRIPKIEGKQSDEWMAIDLGNIALHIFSAKARKQYDLEMLWSVGPDYDNETNKPSDPIFELYDQHSMLWNNLSQKLEPTSLDATENSAPLDGGAHQSEVSDVKN